MPSCGVRLSVCLPVAFLYSVKTNKHIFKKNSLSDRHTRRSTKEKVESVLKKIEKM